MFCDELFERHAIYFHEFNMAGCDEMETYRHTNDDSETDSDDTEIVGAQMSPPNLRTSQIVKPYMFEPYIAMPDGVVSAIAADDAN